MAMVQAVQLLTGPAAPGLEFDAECPRPKPHAFPMNIPQIVGILPAVVFPVATFQHLVRLVRRRAGAADNPMTWLLFGLANLAIYIYTERYTEWQAILGMLVTALVDFIIVGYIWVSRQAEAAGPS